MNAETNEILQQILFELRLLNQKVEMMNNNVDYIQGDANEIKVTMDRISEVARNLIHKD